MGKTQTHESSESAIRVAIVDDDHELASGIAWIINHNRGYHCVGIYHGYTDSVRGLEDARADVLLMDIGLQGESGIDCVRKLKKHYPQLQIIMQTVYSEDEMIFQSLRAGAVGYILKKTTPEQILHAITEAHQGGVPFTGEIARKVLTYFKLSESQHVDIDTLLSDREKDVLQELVKGHPYKKIADNLFISLATVRFHLQNIYSKLHVRSRGAAVAKISGKHLP